MTINRSLLDILADPIDKEPLLWHSNRNLFYNPRTHRAYSVHHGIPVLLSTKVIEVDDAEHEQLIAELNTGDEDLHD